MTGLFMHPLFAENAAMYAIKNATTEGKITVGVLFLLSLFSWSVILTKLRQILIARKTSKKFMAAYAATRDPLDILKKGEDFEGAPAFQLYLRGTEELAYHLKNNPVTVKAAVFPTGTEHTNTDVLSKTTQTKISPASFEALKVVLEEAAGEQAMTLEKGMIILSTAVAGGPFIGLLGTVWGVMSTFASIAESHSASLTTMAPGVAAALVATVTGLLVAIPAMFAYNMMVTTIRFLTQELDGFASRFANQVEHVYVAHRPLAEELREANEALAGRIVGAMKTNEEMAEMKFKPALAEEPV